MKYGFVKIAAAAPAIRVADCAYNALQVNRLIDKAVQQEAKILALPELCLTGYTCGDLLFHDSLLDAAEEALLSVLAHSASLDILVAVGAPLRYGAKLYNCAALLHKGRILGIVPKTHLPNYGEFYEQRHFAPAPGGSAGNMPTITIGGHTAPFGSNILFACKNMPELVIGVEICEDLWAPAPPSINLCAAGATLMLNLSASDETVGKDAYRRLLLKSHSARLNCAYVYADAGEGESTTDMVFSGHQIIAENGLILQECVPFSLPSFAVSEIDCSRLLFERRRQNTFPAKAEEQLLTQDFTLQLQQTTLTRAIPALPFVPEHSGERSERCARILQIQAHGLKKRLQHTGSKKAVVGVSGGLDSTLALLVCTSTMALLGRPVSDVLAITMPCFGTTERTRSNAERLCACLDIPCRTVDITKAVQQHFADIEQAGDVYDSVYENAQARERTQVLMDIANREGGLVVGTGDLSELALGWATYNGDHMSMYAVNASIPKTLIRHIVRYVAENEPSLRDVLLDILDTPVSPELLPAEGGTISQKTESIVGPYELHDFFLYYMQRWGCGPEKLLRLAGYAFAEQYAEQTIRHWLRVFLRRFFSQQFKRSCMPDGPKTGSVSLSPRGDWRMPSDASDAVWSDWE